MAGQDSALAKGVGELGGILTRKAEFEGEEFQDQQLPPGLALRTEGLAHKCHTTLQASQAQASSHNARGLKLYFFKHSQFLFEKKHQSIMGKIRTSLNYLTLI